MWKIFKLASGRFEVYKEEDGNTVMTFPETFGTPEEANAKVAALNGGTDAEPVQKPVDSVQPPADLTPEEVQAKLDAEAAKVAQEQADADAKAKADEEAAAKAKADAEAGEKSADADASKSDADASASAAGSEGGEASGASSEANAADTSAGAGEGAGTATDGGASV